MSLKKDSMHRRLKPRRQEISDLAYRLWEERGRPSGSDKVDWFQAEKLLREYEPLSPHLALSPDEFRQCVLLASRRMYQRNAEWMFMIALAVLEHFFGTEWVREQLYTQGFLKPPPSVPTRLRHLQ